MFHHQQEKIAQAPGFIAALDQSGGSTPKALASYGITENQYNTDREMFDLIHEMRARIMRSDAFRGGQIIGAILFEMTLDQTIEDLPVAQFLWEKCGVVTFLKIDQGLEASLDGVKLMKPMHGLEERLSRAKQMGVFGTKMRSVIDGASELGIKAIVAQQFAVAEEVLAAGMVPILEPEITIDIPDKKAAEEILLDEIMHHLDRVGPKKVMLKLTLPEKPDHYESATKDPRILRVLALSGGYSLTEATERLAQNHGVIASFSRALTQGLSVEQSDSEFEETLSRTIAQIYAASTAPDSARPA